MEDRLGIEIMSVWNCKPREPMPSKMKVAFGLAKVKLQALFDLDRLNADQARVCEAWADKN